MKIPESVIAHLLATWPVARLATLNADGSPHQVPIVFTWYKDRFWSPIDGKPKRDSQLTRVSNALVNPVASILIDKYDEDWTRLWWIRSDLEITVIKPDAADEQTSRTVTQVIEKLEQKYKQYDSIAVLREPAVLLSMQPSAMTSWCAAEVKV